MHRALGGPKATGAVTPRGGRGLRGQAEQGPDPGRDPGVGRPARLPTQHSWLVTLAILEDALKIFSTSRPWRSSLHLASSSSLEAPHEEQV